MNTTGTVVVSALVGAALGFGVAQLTGPPACRNQYVVVDSSASSLSPIHVCIAGGHIVRWEVKGGGRLKVLPKGTSSSTVPFPYNLSCSTWVTSCASGPMVSGVKPGWADYDFIIENGPTLNGRIIIDR
jgi:hypothetical protein